MKPAILIVGFERPNNLIKIYNEVSNLKLPIYIFVDRCNKDANFLNEATISVAMKLTKNNVQNLKISEENFGVGRAVPRAIEWVLKSNESIIILEDDCIPNGTAIRFLTTTLETIKMNPKIAIVAASSPVKESDQINSSFLSKYPLIWGWATTRGKWNSLSRYTDMRVSSFEIIRKTIFRVDNWKSIAFFYAAHLRVKFGLLSAWDSNLALGLILERKYAVVPNLNLITNVGNDEVASHTIISQSNKQIIIASEGEPSTEINSNNKEIDKIIESRIYSMKSRHLLSPLKAIIQVFLHKVRRVF